MELQRYGKIGKTRPRGNGCGPSNDLVSRIYDRMPAILKPAGYARWLGPEPDPRDLLVPFPSEPMTVWPILRRVNSPDNDDDRLLGEIAPPADMAV